MIKWLLLLVVLVSGNMCTAQVDKGPIDKGVLTIAKNYVNYKLTYWMLDVRKNNPEAKITEEDFNLIKPVLESITVNNLPGYDSIKAILLKEFKGTVQKLSDKINSINVNPLASLSPEDAAGKLVDDAFGLLQKNYKEESDQLQSKKNSLVEDVTRIFKNATVNLSVNKDTVYIVYNAQPSVIPDKFSFFWVLVLLLIGALFFYIRYVKKNIHEEISRLIRHKSSGGGDPKNIGNNKDVYADNNKPVYTPIPVNKEDLEKMIIASKFFQDMSKEVEGIQASLEQMNMSRSNKNIFEISTQPENSYEKKAAAETFYMGGPVNNYFPNSAKSYNKENTLYKFIVKVNMQEAAFSIHTGGAPVNEINKRNGSYIKPACIEENDCKADTRNIITKQDGVAVLEGDRWVIKTKAVIRYE